MILRDHTNRLGCVRLACTKGNESRGIWAGRSMVNTARSGPGEKYQRSTCAWRKSRGYPWIYLTRSLVFTKMFLWGALTRIRGSTVWSYNRGSSVCIRWVAVFCEVLRLVVRSPYWRFALGLGLGLVFSDIYISCHSVITCTIVVY
jgi:hypothetical protein